MLKGKNIKGVRSSKGDNSKSRAMQTSLKSTENFNATDHSASSISVPLVDFRKSG
jgi:hypothetical protein